jgi:hypothetical protein
VALHVSVRLLPSRCPAATSSSMTWTPFHFLIVAIAGWMNPEQQQAIDNVREGTRILGEKLRRKRIILNESQEQRLAPAAMELGRDLLRQSGTLFGPATLLRWYRRFVGRKCDGTLAQHADRPWPPGIRPEGREGRQDDRIAFPRRHAVMRS